MTRKSVPEPDWQLRAGRPDTGEGPRPALPRRRLLGAVARRGLPGIVEGSIVPALLFVLATAAFGTETAMLAVLGWGYATIGWRTLRRTRVPSLLVLAMAGLTIRTLVGVVSGSTFAYLVQPIATTVGVAALFLGSVLVGRPLIGRIAHDFCPIAPEIASRPAVTRLFAGLTVLWAVVQLLNAGATLGMLLSLPTTLFVLLKPAATLLTTAVAVVVTVWWALRTAHRERLVFVAA